MNIKEIIDELNHIFCGLYVSCSREELDRKHEVIHRAIDLLRTHQDNQPNEPLRWRNCKKEKPTEKGRYEVVCRNGDIPPYVLLGFYNPDNPGWDLYGVTHWRPMPEPPKEA